MIITIDGPVATGKSAVAKKLASAIGFIFFDTGAVYRTITYGLLKKKIDFHRLEELTAFLNAFELEMKVVRGEKTYFFEKEDITKKIRGPEVTQIVSEVAAIKVVRDKVALILKEISHGVNAVFEGRDMGTVIFPEASIKIFLTGRPEIRAKRRFDEIQSKYSDEFKEFNFDTCLEEINKRDLYDTMRENSPLRQADDAHVIDTSDLTIDEVVKEILDYKDTLKTRDS
jgi:CMP/dCMP kinase